MARVYAGQTATERSDARRRQFLDAGLEVLGTRGWTNATVRGICEEAGLSTRYFYESFPALDALALSLYDDLVEDAIATVAAAVLTVDPHDPGQAARAATGALVDWVLADRRRAQLLLAAGSSEHPLAERRAQTMRRVADVIEQLGRSTYGGSTVGDDSLLRITAALVAGGIAEVMFAWIDGRLVADRDELVEHLARLVVGIGDTARGIALGARGAQASGG
jgi:AcrR family transcriptional regulator